MPTNTKPDKNNQVKEITEKLEAGIKDIFTSEKYLDYLNTISKFHNYSTRNTLLIHQQRPKSTYIAGFNTWKNQFKRNVKKGEKGIRILAPVVYKIEKETVKIDPETQAPLLDKNGDIQTEEIEIKIPRFKVVSVFDVSQTEGEPLPSLAENITGDVRQYEAFMEALKRVSALPIEFAPLTPEKDGLCRYGDKILIREGMSEAQTVLATIHEITHSRLHDKNLLLADDIKAKPKDRMTREIEAESVSYTVCQYYGIETGANSFGYLAAWSKDRDLKELKDSLETIRKTAAELINGIDENFKQIVKERGIKITPQKMPQGNIIPEKTQETPIIKETQEVIHSNNTSAEPEDLPPRTIEDVIRENIPAITSRALYDTEYLKTCEGFSDEQKARSQCEKTVDKIIELLKTENAELYSCYRFVPDFKERIIDTVFKRTYTDIANKLQQISKIGMKKENTENTENTVSHKLFRALKRFAPEIVEGKYGFMRFQAGEGFMPLTFEYLDGNRYALMHYYNQNGDIMKDPDMEIVIDREKHTANALTFTQHPYIFQEVAENQIGSKQQREFNSFLSQWLKNIGQQEYKRELAYMYDENQNQENVYFNSEQKPFIMGMGHMGNGLTVWNSLEEKNGDYVKIAHINADRTVKFYENNLPEYIRKIIENTAKTSEMTISTTQDGSVFNVPPQSETSGIFEEVENEYPPYEGILPDSTIGIAERNEYGYTYNGLLPLKTERALELFDSGYMIYRLYDNNAEGLIESRDEIPKHSGIFGIEVEDWIDSPEYEVVKENAEQKIAEEKISSDTQEQATDKNTANEEYLYPDPSIAADWRDEYGYTDENMLPVTLERAVELFDKDFTVYMLYEDNTEAMVFEREEIYTEHDGIFGIERIEWENSNEYKEAIKSLENAEDTRESGIDSKSVVPVLKQTEEKINTSEINNSEIIAMYTKNAEVAPPVRIGTNVLMTPVFDGMNFNRSGKKIRVKVEEPAGKYQLFSREEFEKEVFYFLTASGRIQSTSQYFKEDWDEQQKKRISHRPTEAELDEIIPKIAERFESDMSNPESWTLYQDAAVVNRLDECEAHNVPVREMREKERKQRGAEAERERQEEQRQKKEKYNTRIVEIAQAIKNGKTISVSYNENDFEGKNPVLDLFKQYGIDLPLKTQGWVNSGLAEITGNGYRYYKGKHKGNSTAFSGYLIKLHNAIILSNKLEIERENKTESKKSPMSILSRVDENKKIIAATGKKDIVDKNKTQEV